MSSISWITGILIFYLHVVQGVTVQELAKDEIEQFVNSSDVSLVGYVPFKECIYTVDFIRQLDVVSNELGAQGIKVGVAYEAAEFNTNYELHGPVLVLYRKEKLPIQISWLTDAKKIVKWVQNRLYIHPVVKLKTQKQFDYLRKNYVSVFAAYLNDSEEIEIYTRVADHFNLVFLITNDSEVAAQILELYFTGIIVHHDSFVNESHVFPRRSNFNEDTLVEWVRNEVEQQTLELTAENAQLAFATSRNDFGILFAPRSWVNFTESILEFEHINKQNKITSLYVDTEKLENKDLLDYFEVAPTNASIVLMPKFRALDQFPFTKRCTKNGIRREKLQGSFTDANMFQYYRSNVRSRT